MAPIAAPAVGLVSTAGRGWDLELQQHRETRRARRAAAAPAGVGDLLRRTWRESSSDNLGLVAAGVAFYGFLASVPLLAAFVLTYGLVADPATVMSHVRAIFDLLPTDAARLIGEQLVQVTESASGKTGIGLAIALLLALYGAMRGATAIMTALNIVYDEEERRGFGVRMLLSLAITVGMVLVGLVLVVAISALGLLESLVPGAPAAAITLIRIGFWIVAAAVAGVAISIVYRYAPDRPTARWRWITPGSAVATLGSLAMTLGFGFYVANFGSYNATYGALGAVVVLLMWLYLSAYILLLGGELNAELEARHAGAS